MKYKEKTKGQLIEELEMMRRRVSGLKAIAANLKGTEESLRKSEEKLRPIIQSREYAIVNLDREGNVIFWNYGAKSIFGYSSDEILGNSIMSIVPERFRGPHKNGLGHFFSEGTYKTTEKTLELIGQNKNGEEFPVELSLETWNIGKELCITGIMHDISKRKEAENELRQNLHTLRKAMGGFIQAISLIVGTRDPYTAGHQKRTADLARAIGNNMGLLKEQVDGIRMAGVIHDLGKIQIPAEILSKPGKISENEFGLIKRHPQVGYDILNTIDFPWPIAKIISQHHEKMDGNGYPLGISGEKILIEARVLCVADVVEAIASHRPYRPSLGIDTALDEITSGRGIKYDSNVVDACMDLFKEKDYVFK